MQNFTFFPLKPPKQNKCTTQTLSTLSSTHPLMRCHAHIFHILVLFIPSTINKTEIFPHMHLHKKSIRLQRKKSCVFAASVREKTVQCCHHEAANFVSTHGRKFWCCLFASTLSIFDGDFFVILIMKISVCF